MVDESLNGRDVILLGAMRHLDERAMELRAELAQVERARSSLEQVVSRGSGSAIKVDDETIIAEIDRCRNQREGLKAIARRQGGRVRVRDAAKLIERSSLTKAKLQSIRATLLRYVKESDDWIEEGDGFFALVGDDFETLYERMRPVVTVHEADGTFRPLEPLGEAEAARPWG